MSVWIKDFLDDREDISHNGNLRHLTTSVSGLSVKKKNVLSSMKCHPVDSYRRTKQEHRNYEIDFDTKFDYEISHYFSS